ncbi:MAG: thioredoxin domain-containing protein [Acidobacteria bacterium]|nr:thioredoxin domain-containing protein [Acidobacteriota bacterium]
MFYLWRAHEIDALIGGDATPVKIVKARFGIEPGGNAPQDPQQEFVGKNLLYIARSIDDIAKDTGKTTAEVSDILNRTRKTLFERRIGRPRPQRDDKILTAWNGLMIAAFARMSRLLRGLGAENREAAERYLQAARGAAVFLRDRMWNASTGVLLRRYREGHAEIDGYAEDYAYLVAGLLDLFQADPDPAWLDWAMALQRRQDEVFWDERDGGWFSTTGRDPSVLLRMKEDYDGAEPTASSVSVLNLLWLSHLVPGAPDSKWSDRVDRTLRLFGTRLEQVGRAVPMMASALSTYTAGLQQVVLVDGHGSDELQRAIALRYLPFAIVLTVNADQRRALADRLPFIGAMQPVDGAAAVYVCRNFTCRQPVTAVEGLAREFEDVRS